MKRPHGASALALILIFTLLLGPGSASAEETGTVAANSDVKRLYEKFGVKNVSVNYLVVIDTSLSMTPIFEQTREAVNSLTESLKPGDTLTVISFNNQPKIIYTGRIGKNTKQLITRLPKTPDKDGRRTDIGAAIDSVLDQTKRTKSDLQLVFFMTDGRNEPPEDSRFQTADETGWSKLKEKANTSRKVVKVHGIGLGADTDIGMLRRVFPDSNQITVDPAGLKDYFRRLKDEIRLERLKIKLDRELKAGRVKIIPVGGSSWGRVSSGQEVTRRYRVTSGYKKLPVDIKLGRPKLVDLSDQSGATGSSDFKLRLIGKERFQLKAGESRLIKIKLKMPAFRNRLRVGQISSGYDGRVDFGLRSEVQPRSALNALGLKRRNVADGSFQRISFYRLIGQSSAILAALALAVLMIGAVLAKTVFMPLSRSLSKRIADPPLDGRITFIKAPPGRSLPPPVSLSALGARATIGAAGNIVISGAGIAGRHVEIYSVWEAGEPSVRLRKLEGEARVAGSARESGRLILDDAILKRGSVIEIGDYRMQWV